MTKPEMVKTQAVKPSAAALTICGRHQRVENLRRWPYQPVLRRSQASADGSTPVQATWRRRQKNLWTVSCGRFCKIWNNCGCSALARRGGQTL